jgi:hypothetical protein
MMLFPPSAVEATPEDGITRRSAKAQRATRTKLTPAEFLCGVLVIPLPSLPLTKGMTVPERVEVSKYEYAAGSRLLLDDRP